MFHGPSPDQDNHNPNRIVIFDDDEMEMRRLRHVFEENILKVEKENMEIIKKMANNNPAIFSKGKKTKEDTKPKEIIQTTTHKGMKRLVCSKVFENERDSSLRVPFVNADDTIHAERSECKFSNIHFLNHLQSAFLSSKTYAQNLKSSESYIPCAVPLAPPIQKSSVSIQKINTFNNKFPQNTVLHHVISDVDRKELSVQVLPSVTIQETIPKHHKNVLNEEIKKKDYFEGDGIKTTTLPAISNEEKIRLSKIKLSSLNYKKPPDIVEKSDMSNASQNKNPVSAESSENLSILRNTEVKEQLKDIFKEVLQGFAINSDKDNKPCDLIEKVPTVLPSVNDCALDSFLGNIDNTKSHGASKSVSKSIADTQTGREELSADAKTQIRYMVQEIIAEMQLSSAEKEKEHNENKKGHKEIQTTVPTSEKETQDIIVCTPKSTQVCFREDASVKCDSATETDKNAIETDLTEDNISPRSVGNLISRYHEDSRLQTVLDSIYEHLCTQNISHSQESMPVVSRDIPPISTREVSVQINPVSTLTKSTCTSDVLRVDSAEQCSLISGVKEPEKQVKHAHVQVEIVLPELNQTVPPQMSDTYVQCERPALANTFCQTVEYLVAPPEHSANTSVSTTPVSDSMFLDDMLSEGEVFLPCNLRLSGSDNTVTPSSKNDTEMSGNSDKDQDYSLSEGEIHPRYLQLMKMQKLHTDRNYIGSHTMPSTTFSDRNSGVVHQDCRFSTTLERSCYSSSSLSDGEIRCCSTPLSEGEIPPHLWKNIPRSPFQGISQSRGTLNSASQHSFSGYTSDLLFESDPRRHYQLSAPLEKLDGGVNTIDSDEVSEDS